MAPSKAKFKAENCITALFIAAETAIFIAFNVLVATRPDDPVYLKYSGVLLCLAASAALCAFYKSDAVLLTAAIAFTAVSDYFILVIDKFYELGVTTFFIAQCIYFFRLYKNRSDLFIGIGKLKLRALYLSAAARLVAAIIAIVALGVAVGLSARNMLALFRHARLQLRGRVYNLRRGAQKPVLCGRAVALRVLRRVRGIS